MNEADEQFAARLSEDLDKYFGPEISLQELDLGDVEAGHAHLRATCVFHGGSEVLESDGETRLKPASMPPDAIARNRTRYA